MIGRPTRKRCSYCKRWLRVIAGTTFHTHVGQSDGLQPFCMECDHRGEVEVTRAWGKLRKALEASGSELYWTEDVYRKKLVDANYLCHYCGTKVYEWGSGYWLDRQSNGDERYRPESTVVCCWPCNCQKAGKNVLAWHEIIRMYRCQYPAGLDIPWDQIDDRFSRRRTPDLSQYVCDPQLVLPFGNGE